MFRATLFRHISEIQRNAIKRRQYPLGFVRTTILGVRQLRQKVNATRAYSLAPRRFTLIRHNVVRFTFNGKTVRGRTINGITILGDLLNRQRIDGPFTLAVALYRGVLLSTRFTSFRHKAGHSIWSSAPSYECASAFIVSSNASRKS